MEAIIYIYIFLLGAIFGSFYRVVATRLPENKSIISPGSYCPKCKHDLKWYDLIPIISYISTLGKCRYCHKKIAVSYLITEIATGVLFLAAYIIYGSNYLLDYEFIVCLILFSLNILIFISDFNYFIILDSPLVLASIIIIILDIVCYGWKYALSYIISGIILFIAMFLIKKFGDILFKRESLGGGDIKLSFIVGLVLGLRLGICAIILSTFLALPYSLLRVYLSKEKEVPFGPFIIGACTIVFLFIDKFTNLLNYLFY